MVEINNLTFGYEKKNILFENLNLTLRPGHIYGLLGKNGAGKSTLIKNIIGLAFPLTGSCRINGYNSAERRPEQLEDVFLIPEEIYLPDITIKRFVNSTSGFYPKFDESQFFSYLRDFEVGNDAKISRLSFGQQKKVMIAFALAANTSLLVMDEPTNGLDIPSKIQFRKMVSTSVTDDRCILISTHQVRDLDNLIDRVIVLNNRTVVLETSVDTIGERLLFSTTNSLDDGSILYSEQTVKGHSVITPNISGRTSKVDLEMLFNALISDDSKIMNEFKQFV